MISLALLFFQVFGCYMLYIAGQMSCGCAERIDPGLRIVDQDSWDLEKLGFGL